VLAGAALLAADTFFALRGVLLFDDPLAGAALDSLIFALVLLSAALPLLAGWIAPAHAAPPAGILQIIWLYPLLRLYSVGPWNDGWSFATLLLGGAMGLWAALGALGARAERVRAAQTRASFLGMALAGAGLGTGAGIAAAFAAIGAVVILAAADEDESMSDAPPPLARWLLSGAIPLSAPFIATWMLVGAAAAAGVSIVAGAAWLIALLSALAVAIAPPPQSGRRRIGVAAIAALIGGVCAPLMARWIAQPAIEQLQGGLTVYGDLNIWPWVGLAAIDSARREVTALPSFAAAALMLVLAALVYLIARLREPASGGDDAGMASADELRDALDAIRSQVPWLGGDDRRRGSGGDTG
jgi:hypothetical protein